MKKSLIALAALATVGAAQAQSSVTLYGTIDASVHSINKATAATSNTTAYVDGAVASSVWGFRGSEDLGGGLRATFETQGDLMTNNGGTHTNGLFRRAANVGIASASMGQIELGLKLNPLIAANGALMPVSGNSVGTMTATVLGYADFFTRNAVTYTSPTVGGLSAQLQYGFSNIPGEMKDGSVAAYNFGYANGPLRLTFAGQHRQAVAQSTDSLSSANASTPALLAAGYNAATGLSAGTAARDAMKKDTMLLGARYQVTNQLNVGVAYIRNTVSNNDSDNTSTGTGGLAVTTGKTKVEAYQLGVGYQATPKWLLGASVTSAENSRLYNTQARYAFSKRTTAYVQAALADNDSNGTVKFFPVGANTGTAPAAVMNAVGVAGQNQSSVGLGMIHTF